MRYQYRITKYDPSLRSQDGAFQVDDWTSCSDIGRVFSGKLLAESDYRAVEQAYLSSVEDCLREAHLHALELRDLENRSRCEMPNFVRTRNTLTIEQCIEFSRLTLRELVWGRLVAPARGFVHFGHDYYLYVGLPTRCTQSIGAAAARGLLVEPFRSPYLRAAPTRAAQHDLLCGARTT